MLIPPPTSNDAIKTLPISINALIMAEVNAYCAAAGITDVHYFFEQAMLYIFTQDEEWCLFKLQKS